MTYKTPGLDAMLALAFAEDVGDDSLTDATFTTMVEMGINILKMTRLSYAIGLETGNAALDALIKDAETMLASAVEQLGTDATQG